MEKQPSRDIFAELALEKIPFLTMLVDRNPYSPTYGCFDREYWHYRTLDFPCGMSQEFVLPFALLYKNAYPGNRFQGWERMKEIAVAGMRFAMRASHKDGTCDDYFPYERAMGALVFSTYAATEAYQILELNDPELVDFFALRGQRLIEGNETGRLSNHQALAALMAYNLYLLTNDEKFKRLSEERAELTLSWQHPYEGWFQEYEGADPGYHTCSIDFLAKLYQKNHNESLIGPLKKAVEFAWHFMHPDGSYGGEYGSRNTYHYYPHGMEILAPHTEKAAQLNDAFLQSVIDGKRYRLEDNRMVCHLVYNWLQAWKDYHPGRPGSIHERENFSRWFKDAGLFVKKTNNYYAVTNLRKGGVVKVFNSEGCQASDTGLVAEMENGDVMVTHLMDDTHAIDADPAKSTFTVEGHFARRSTKLASPTKLILFRLINLTAGRFFPNAIRFLLQKILITGKKRSPWKFRRTVSFGDKAVKVRDVIPQAFPVWRLSASTDATSIYVAASNPYQESVLRLPWEEAPEEVLMAARGGLVTWERCHQLEG